MRSTKDASVCQTVDGSPGVALSEVWHRQRMEVINFFFETAHPALQEFSEARLLIYSGSWGPTDMKVS